jgi:hypothetical protein
MAHDYILETADFLRIGSAGLIRRNDPLFFVNEAANHLMR